MSSDDSLVLNSDGSLSELPVSMQIYQAVYNDITGKTEVLTDNYYCNFELSMENIVQLKYKIAQFCEQYHIESQNNNITVFHSKSSKERFSSFERFISSYNSSSNSYIEKVIIEVNILIILPKTKKPQSYKITITLTSMLALLKKYKSELSRNIPVVMLLKTLNPETCKVKIEYIDYIFARSISDLIREWQSSFSTIDNSSLVEKLQDLSNFISKSISFTFISVSILLALKYSNIFLSEHLISETRLSRFLIIAFSFIIFSGFLGDTLGGRIEKSIDSIENSGYSVIKFNNGDDELAALHVKKIKNSKRHVIKEIALVISLGVIASVLANLLSPFITQ